MPDRAYIRALQGAFLIAIMAQLIIASQAVGGIDIDRYWNYSYLFEFSDLYYVKELVSWFTIRVVSDCVARAQFIEGIAIAGALMVLVSTGWKNGLALEAAFLSPFGVLLEFNVLRQFFGVILLAAALHNLIEERMRRFLVFAVLAILAHNSNLIILAAVGACLVFVRSPPQLRIAIVPLGVFLIFGLQVAGVFDLIVGERAGSLLVDSSSGYQNAIYAFVAVAYSGILYFISPKSRLVAAGLLVSVIMFVAITYAFGLEDWVYGRIALSDIVVVSFLIFVSGMKQRRRDIIEASAPFAVLLVNAALIPFHPGAVSMISGWGTA